MAWLSCAWRRGGLCKSVWGWSSSQLPPLKSNSSIECTLAPAGQRSGQRNLCLWHSPFSFCVTCPCLLGFREFRDVWVEGSNEVIDFPDRDIPKEEIMRSWMDPKYRHFTRDPYVRRTHRGAMSLPETPQLLPCKRYLWFPSMNLGPGCREVFWKRRFPGPLEFPI